MSVFEDAMSNVFSLPGTTPRATHEAIFINGSALPAGWTFARASGATRINASGVLEEVGADVLRYQHDTAGVLLGALLEPAATNENTNPRFEGAVAGSPGTLPPGMGEFLPPATRGTVVRTVVGTGVEDGRHYIDIRYAGTTVGSCSGEFYLDASAASGLGETWTTSLEVRLVGGTAAGLNTHLAVVERNGGAYLVETQTAYVPDATRRFVSTTRTTSNAAVTNVRTTARIGMNGAVDYTLRFYDPQLERGAFPTSRIRPPPLAPAAASRAADTLSTPAVDLSRITIAGRVAPARWGATGDSQGFYLHAGEANGNASLRLLSNGPAPPRDVLAQIRTSNVARFNVFSSPDPGPDEFFSWAYGYDVGVGLVSFRGTQNVPVAPASTPARTDPIILGGAPTGGISTPAVWRFFRAWNRRLADSQIIREGGRLT